MNRVKWLFLFYYNNTWTTLIGYPAGHGQDTNINDHHFHWGYFIHAAAFMEQFEPGWANQWGDMINLLVRDAASSTRTMTNFLFYETLAHTQVMLGPMDLLLSHTGMTKNPLQKVCNSTPL